MGIAKCQGRTGPLSIVSDDLKVSQQCISAANKANKVLGIVKRQFKNLDKASFLILYKGVG